MGGSPTQAMKDYQYYGMKAAMKKPPVEEDAIVPVDEEANANFWERQRTADDRAMLINAAKNIVPDSIATFFSQNFRGRDISPAPTQDKTK